MSDSNPCAVERAVNERRIREREAASSLKGGSGNTTAEDHQSRCILASCFHPPFYPNSDGTLIAFYCQRCRGRARKDAA